MDVSASLRDYLRENGVHNYDVRAQASLAKVERRAFYVHHDGLEEMNASLYSPETKNGDPCIWSGKLQRYVKLHNLLALTVGQDHLFDVNWSAPNLFLSLNDFSIPPGVR